MTLASSLKLVQHARAVQTREDPAALVLQLKADLENNPEAWESANLPQFLGAMSAWIESMDGYYANTGQNLSTLPPWRIFADILMGARLQE